MPIFKRAFKAHCNSCEKFNPACLKILFTTNFESTKLVLFGTTAVRGGRGTAGIKPSARIMTY